MKQRPNNGGRRDWLDIPPVDAVGWLVQGKLFAARDRHDLAIDAYKRRIEMPAAPAQINLTDVRVLITTACLKVGRFEDAIDWSELALKLESSRSRMLTLTRLAGAACSTLGRVSEQEDHYRRAYELALEAQNKKSMADSLACLAELERSRGNLAKVLSMCLEAECSRRIMPAKPITSMPTSAALTGNLKKQSRD